MTILKPKSKPVLDKQSLAKKMTGVNPLVDGCYDSNCYNEACFDNYAHLITTRPHEIRRVFVSDLHLSSDEPALVQAFLGLLADCIALPHLMALYILGDWFDMWIGDDAYLTLTDLEKQRHWLTPIISQLQQLNANGCQILVMHGNRDFLISQKLCDTFDGQLITEPYYLEMGGKPYRLEHGDALCTDDVGYQRMRKILRYPLIRWGLLKIPLAKRQQLAAKIRQQSARGKATKAEAIMDVNLQAVAQALSTSDALLHGHTHRPACHPMSVRHTPHASKVRYVLGDWRLQHPKTRQQCVEAVIGMVMQTGQTMPTEQLTQPVNNHLTDITDASTEIEKSEDFLMVNFRY